jgi:hypothetical protein
VLNEETFTNKTFDCKFRDTHIVCQCLGAHTRCDSAEERLSEIQSEGKPQSFENTNTYRLVAVLSSIFYCLVGAITCLVVGT